MLRFGGIAKSVPFSNWSAANYFRIRLTFLVLFDKNPGMKARLIASVAALVCVLFIGAEAVPTVRNIRVLDGPTPFISFVHATVSDVADFESAQFRILPKKGSATRPIKVRYARSYLEERGYFDPKTGELTVPVFGLYAGRANRVIVTLGFNGRVGNVRGFSVNITTPSYDGGTYSSPTVVQPR